MFRPISWIRKLFNGGGRARSPMRRTLNLETLEDRITPTAPVAVNDTFNVHQGVTLSVVANGILANDSDAESDPLTASVVSSPTHASYFYLLSDGSFYYTPTAGYVGADSFTYKANDGTSDSNTATVTINVTNTAPSASNDSYTVHQGQSFHGSTVFANDSDANGDTLTLVIVSSTSHASYFNMNSDGSFEYTPDTGYVGSDTFTYKANDGAADSSIATVSLSVTNNAPTASSDSYNIHQGNALAVAASHGVLHNDADADGDTLTANLISDVSHGYLALSDDGSYNYLPDSGYSGSDSFTYEASDGAANTSTVTVTINVTNDAPLASDDTYFVVPNESIYITAAIGVLSNDYDPNGDTLTADIVATASHGYLLLSTDGSFTYSPDTDYTGPDSFTYEATDGAEVSDTVTVNIFVGNHAPTVYDLLAGTDENTPVTADFDGMDLDEGDTFTFSVVSGPTKGILTNNNDGTFTFDPNGEFTGSIEDITFTYKATDNHSARQRRCYGDDFRE